MNRKKIFTFLWYVENFSYCWHRIGDRLISPIFTVDGLENTAWTLWLYPRGVNDEKRARIELYRNMDNGPDWVDVKCHISIDSHDRSTIFKNGCDYSFEKNASYVMVDFLSHLNVPCKDIFTVRCKLSSCESDNACTYAAPICAHTRIEIERISFLHAIEGFSNFKPNQKNTLQIQSHTQKSVESCMYISDEFSVEKVIYKIKPSNPFHFLAKFELYLLDASGIKIKCAEADYRFHHERKDIILAPQFFLKEELMKKKGEYLPDDSFSLICECTLSLGIAFEKVERIQNATMTVFNPPLVGHNPRWNAYIFKEKLSACSSVPDGLKEIYNNSPHDLELKTETGSFSAHRDVLCANSPVFKAMMSYGTKEKISGSIKVDDLDDQTVEKLLLFLYSEELKNLEWEMATNLYYVADKYDIKKLKLLCSAFMVNNLTTSTATELLGLADTFSDSVLKNVAINFILDYDRHVFGSNEWKKLMEEYPQLALKTMRLKYQTRSNME